MSKKSRMRLFTAIEKKRNSRLLTYITGDKPNFPTKIADDVIPLLYKQLKIIGKVEKIDLLIYSRGGNTLTPWRLINLLKEFAEQIAILIPHRAHSAATLLTLGADEIIMGPLGELSPIDPSVTTPFNPTIKSPNNVNQPIPVSVEDVISYFNLAREKVGIKSEESLVEIFKKLTDQIPPLALGSINRSHSQIRDMANRMLDISGKVDSETKKKIVDILTEKLFNHEHMINRKEAITYGLKVIFAESKEAGSIEEELWALYEEYVREMQLNEPLNPKKIMKRRTTDRSFKLSRALIESRNMIQSFDTRIKIHPVIQGDVTNFNIDVEDLGWEEVSYK